MKAYESITQTKTSEFIISEMVLKIVLKIVLKYKYDLSDMNV